METRFVEEFMKSDVGFWIFTKQQMYFSFGAMGGALLLFGQFLDLIPRLIISIFLGFIIGFFAGLKIKNIFGYQYILWMIKFYFEKIINGNKGDLLIQASAFNTQSTVEVDDDAYRVVEVQKFLMKEL